MHSGFTLSSFCFEVSWDDALLLLTWEYRKVLNAGLIVNAMTALVKERTR